MYMGACIWEHEILSRKIRDLEVAHCEDFVILACTVLINKLSLTHSHTLSLLLSQYIRDGQTNGRRDDDNRDNSSTVT